jgi:hypothetical protein
MPGSDDELRSALSKAWNEAATSSVVRFQPGEEAA